MILVSGCGPLLGIKIPDSDGVPGKSGSQNEFSAVLELPPVTPPPLRVPLRPSQYLIAPVNSGDWGQSKKRWVQGKRLDTSLKCRSYLVA